MKHLRDWIARKIAFSKFDRQSDVMWFALTRGAATTIVAILLNLLVYQLLERFPLIEVTVPQDRISDSIVTALVAGPISLVAYYLIGSAIRDLSISRTEFERLSRTDPLTGLLNRRAFMDIVSASQPPYALAIIDIDRFKLVNDTWGHGAGDEVLIHVARTMEHIFGQMGQVARLGGEEFAVVLFGMDKLTAISTVDQYRQKLASCPVVVGGRAIAVTISVGVSQCRSDYGHSILLTDADRALYLAKAAGRNRVVHADELAPILSPRNAGRLTEGISDGEMAVATHVISGLGDQSRRIEP